MLVGVAALVAVIPLRNLFEAFPLVLFVAALALFMVPGALLTHWLAGEHLSGGAQVPVAFVISVSVYGILGIPFLLLGLNVGIYLGLCGLVLVCFLAAAAVSGFRGRPGARVRERAASPLELVLGALFLVLTAILAFVSRLRIPDIYEDIWVYTAWVREFANTDSLASYEPYFGNSIEGLSRAKVNGWLLEQAALSRVSGLDPVELVLNYLTPTLVVVALLSFYALSRVLIKNEAAALFTGCLCALFFLSYLSPGIHVFGGELIGRAAEDKLVARFTFLPVALIFAVLFLEHRRVRYLGLFALVVWAVVSVHPIGLAIICLATGSFVLVYVAVNLRDRRAWSGAADLGMVLASALVPPVILLAAGQQSAALYSADINSGDPRVLANMVFVRPEWRHILEFENGSFIMHPFLLLTPAIAVAYLLGLPFLAFRLRRGLAAPMLLGIMVVIALLVYVPPVATFFGNEIIVPGQLWRMAWPIPLAALITLGWMSWWATVSVAGWLNWRGLGSRWTEYLPVLLVLVIALGVAPLTVLGARAVYEARDLDPVDVAGYPADPIFDWMDENIAEPAVVLAPDPENTVIPAYSSSADVVSLRGRAIINNLDELEARVGEEIDVPRRALDVQEFYDGTTTEEAFEILRRREVDYVLVPENTVLEYQLDQMTGFDRVRTPSERYSLFEVNL
ncbi:MAG: DUF6077 domain-containing protein [Rubrobacteraceae bacterium]